MINKLNEEIIIAMKAKDSGRLIILRMLLSEIKNIAISKCRKEINEEDLIIAVSKGIKQLQDGIKFYIDIKRNDIVERFQYNLVIYQEFQPEQMTVLEITELVDKLIAETGATTKKQMGMIMGKLMPDIKGKADGKMVSQIVNKKLS